MYTYTWMFKVLFDRPVRDPSFLYAIMMMYVCNKKRYLPYRHYEYYILTCISTRVCRCLCVCVCVNV